MLRPLILHLYFLSLSTMFATIAALSLLLFGAADALNDWSVPCTDGTCSWDLGNPANHGKGATTGTLQIVSKCSRLLQHVLIPQFKSTEWNYQLDFGYHGGCRLEDPGLRPKCVANEHSPDLCGWFGGFVRSCLQGRRTRYCRSSAKWSS